MDLRKLAFFIAVSLLISTSAFATEHVLYAQQFDQTGNAYSSQNDTAGFGLFAQVYDNFTINAGGPYYIDTIMFPGEYFNPPAQGPIAGWTLTFYADAAGQPGAALFTQHFAGTGNETFMGNYGGFPTYGYRLDDFKWDPLSGVQYWVSVYPDLPFPPQWGWSSGTGGDGISYQDFFGARSPLSADMAFALWGDSKSVPEPGIILMLGPGLLVAGGMLRRKLS